MDTETIALAVVLVAKVLTDIAFGKKALTEVKLLREELGKLTQSVTARLDNHETRLDKLEVN